LPGTSALPAAGEAQVKRNRVVRLTVILGGCFAWAALAPRPAAGQLTDPIAETAGEPVTGEMGITETVAEIEAREAALGRYMGPPTISPDLEAEYPDRSFLSQDPASPNVSQWPPPEPGSLNSDAAGRDGTPFLPQTIGTNFLGAQFSEASGFIPPDTQGAVGPTQIGIALNGRVKWWNKQGTSTVLNTGLNSFFNSVRDAYDTSDPRVRFDRTSNRWFVSAVNIPSNYINNRVLLAVSSGPTISNQSSFTFFYFVFSQGGGTQDVGDFADYPTLGVDANALYVGVNVWNGSLTQYLGTTGFVVRKSSMTGGGPIVYTPFRRIANGGSNGPYCPSGPDNDDPNATEGYFVGVDNAVFGRVTMRRVTDPAGTPTISANLFVTVPSTTNALAPPCLGSSHPLSATDDRHFNAMIHLNRITGQRTLWMAHNFQVNASGQASGSGGRSGARWYEIQNLTTTPALRQAGTLYSSAASNPASYIFPGVAMSGQGHMAIGTTVCGATEHAEIAVAGRLNDDPNGSTQAPTLAQTTSYAYNIGLQGTSYRWGDYSFTGVDPADDMTLWTAQEYCNATNSWGIRIIQLKAPPPATPASCVPATVSQGAANVDVVVTGTTTNGSGFYDTDASYTNRMTASVSDTGVTVNSLTWTSPTEFTLNVSVAADAATTARDIAVVNPDNQNATSAGGILTIAAAQQVCVGDCNCDGVVNFDDINAFVAVLGGGTPCSFANCDINGDSVINFDDINPFVAALSAGVTCP
jgi:hypothetical protein